ncbi:Tetraacyldisaccharide 4'-kinase [Stieleria maiorica]|uniref:Tetraacyldisaccharide 4'-kinase n=1 Tax=Stieleria maiorica TaxID=2795974 RepID=A0A5B9MHQ7_9BACT|nr:tetraacyldisaccharide 4'-kinase [Stieleria maiorica]QEF99586.1 Tetraacyldisaccharide 4'-kinase [Stieleria maiorica]
MNADSPLGHHHLTRPLDYRSIMSGHRRGISAGLMRAGLALAAVPYRLVVAQRNRGFDRGQGVERCAATVISVGNLTTGGTGKTPIVADLARRFRRHDIRVAIVSRGYGRGDADQNDEAAELHQRLPDVPHVQNPDRVEAARIAVEELESQLILMDDGFQHRRLHRDLDIVLVDMTCPFGYGHLLPRGLLREPIKSLRRAQVAILTRCDQVDEPAIDDVIATIRSANPAIVILRSSHRPSGLLQFPDQQTAVEDLRGQRVGLISGIGNPAAFRRTAEDVGAIVVAEKILPDHAHYDRETVERLRQWATDLGDARQLICTQKDLVKLQTDRIATLPLSALTIDAEIEPSTEFDAMLQQIATAIHTTE